MVTTRDVERVTPGVTVTLNMGVDTFDGDIMHGTADRSVSFWAPTEKEAVSKANEYEGL